MTDRFAFTDVASGGAGIGNGPIVNCNDPDQKANNPVCTFEACTGDCRWPTTGQITQGPGPSCGSHSDGEDANAVDIATNGNSVVVYSVLNGKVIDINNSCGDYQGSTDEGNTQLKCGGGYGNYIKIQGTSPVNQKTYTIIYGHLQSAMNVQAGSDVQAGDNATPLGKMDNSGYTSGQHLHFGVLSGGNVLDILPNNAPFPITSVNGCNSDCTNACPTEVVSP